MNTTNLTTAAMQLNLDAIKTKLMHVQSGEGWSLERAEAVEKEYRRFLCLMKLYPNEPTAPLVDVDTFWHYHILDTLKYAVDCEQVFGYFLHHYPYIGMRGEGDEQVRIDSGSRMKTLYETTFGEAYPAAAMAGRPAPAASYGDSLQRGRAGFPVSGIYLGTAWCGGPWPDKTGPAKTASADTSTAWCGGPWPDKSGPAKTASADTSTAWCGGPWPDKSGPAKTASADTSTAWCGGPWPDKSGPAGIAAATAAAVGAATAWCGGPWPDKSGPAVALAAVMIKGTHTLH